MAIQIGNFLHGRIGDLVYKVVNGKQIVTRRPVQKKRKLAQKTIYGRDTFGLGTSLSSVMRKSIVPLLHGFNDSDLSIRLTSKIVKALRSCRDPKTMEFNMEQDSFRSLDFFECNKHSELAPRIKFLSNFKTAQNLLEVVIPSFNTLNNSSFPYNSVRCTVRVNLSYFRIWDGLMSADQDTQMTVIDRSSAAYEGHAFYFNLPQGSLCMVTAFLEYSAFSNKQYTVINSHKFSPACILNVFLTPGSYQNNDNIKWIKMRKFEKTPKSKAPGAKKHLLNEGSGI